MAAGYECIGEDCPKPVNWLVTHMSPPGTLAICDDDFPVIVIPVLAQALGVDAGRLYDVIRKHVDKEAKAAAKALEAAAALEAGKELDPFTDPRPCEVCGEMLQPGEAHLHFGVPPQAEGATP